MTKTYTVVPERDWIPRKGVRKGLIHPDPHSARLPRWWKGSGEHKPAQKWDAKWEEKASDQQ